MKTKFRRPKTINEEIYEYLKNAIIEGELKANQRIQKKQMAESFSVSSTPVRDAIQRLIAEKYLVVSPRKEVFVASASKEEIKELFELIKVLDTTATKKALPKMTDEDITELRNMTERLGIYARQKKPLSYSRLNLAFHEKIWKLCGNRFLFSTLVDLMEKTIFFSAEYFENQESSDYFGISYQDHIVLMEAIEKRDSARVEIILSQHWGKGYFKQAS